MYGIFSLLDEYLIPEFTFFFGLMVFWIVGISFSLTIIGRENFWEVVKPNRPSFSIALLIVGILFFVGSSLVPMEFASPLFFVMFIIIGLADGFVYEFLFRGVYHYQFKDRPFIQLIMSSVFFILLGIAAYPFMVIKGEFVMFVISGFMFGLLLAFITKRTGNAWWAIFTHSSFTVIFLLIG